jgi:hypothetical protein
MQAPLAILLVAVSTLGIPTASHAESSTQPTANLSLPKSTAGEITLSDLRDVGLCVMQIKQQAINIYLEATRKPISQKANAHMTDPMSISITGLDPKAEYLATRPEWLTFYVSTMEPILHLFKEDVKDAESGVKKITVPKGTKDRFEKLFDQYETAVEQLNKHVSVIYDQIAVPNNNVRIAEEAVKIFELANEIEKDRQQVFRLVQSAEGGEVEQVIPKKKAE